ncbi:MAG: sensor histidine kinase [Planctomycetota bacterium]
MDTRPREVAEAVLETLSVAVLVADEGGQVRWRNRLARQWLPEADRLEAVGAALDDGAGVDLEEQESVRQGALRLTTPDGAARSVEVHLRRLEGTPPATAVMIADVSDRLSVQRRLAATERMAAVGKLAANVAHELNNPLDGIGRFLGLTARAVAAGEGDKALMHIAKARAGLERMGRIVAGLLDASRSAGREGYRQTIRAAVDQALDVMAPAIEADNIVVVCDLAGSERGLVPGEVFQVLCNLIRNAVDAMDPGGRLTIATCGDGRRETITVADTGPGFPPEALADQGQKAFEAFYSTKTGGSGTGLGLGICRDIVTRAGGMITLTNGANGGAVVTITLPYASTGGEEVGHG